MTQITQMKDQERISELKKFSLVSYLRHLRNLRIVSSFKKFSSIVDLRMFFPSFGVAR